MLRGNRCTLRNTISGGFEVEKKDGVHYCPVKDKQSDNPEALCDICIARQTPLP